MAKWAAIDDWLLKEQDVLASADDPAAGQPPTDVNPPGMPGAGAGGPPQDMAQAPDPMSQPAPPANPADIEPLSPDMPEDKDKINFEQWRAAFFRDSIKGDVNELIEKISFRKFNISSYIYSDVDA